MKAPGKSALDLCEEATYLLRQAPGQAWAAYYIGTLPFLLGFLFFWAEMSHGALAYEHCAPGSLGMALLYLWMIAWQSRFVALLRSELTGEPAPRWSAPHVWRGILIQWALQPTKFVTLPVAGLILLPYASAYAFYQNLMALAPAQTTDLSASVSTARRQSVLWQQQNWMLLAILTLFGTIVFANVAILIAFAPYLVRMLLGIETEFTRAGVSILNTTFLAIVWALGYLAVNPLAKAVYLLRCFYGESLATGEDLRADLKIGVIAMKSMRGTLVLLLLTAAAMRAQQPNAIPTERLNSAIDQTLHRPEFTWRMPRPIQPPDNSNWFIRASLRFVQFTKTTIAQIKHLIGEIVNWFDEKLRKLIPGMGNNASPDARKIRTLVYTLLTIVVIVLGWTLWQAFRNRSRKPAVQASAVALSAIDLNDENLQADGQKVDEWLSLARQFAEAGELRLALRALYLAGLAELAERSLISIDRTKSNQDYARELRRRVRSKPDLLQAFGTNMNVFERSWYGMHEVDAGIVQEFESNLSRIKTCAQQ